MPLPKADSERSVAVLGPIPQFVASIACFRCDVCCRFPDSESSLRPYFTQQEIAAALEHGLTAASFPDASGSQIRLIPNPTGEGYLCPAFDPATNRCGIYEARPLDCQLYPLALMWNANQTGVLLGWDTKCPFIREAVPDSITAYAARVAVLLAGEAMIEMIVAHPRLIGRFQDDVIVLQPLPHLTARLLSQRVDPRLRPLTVSDGPRFARALERAGVLSPDAPAAYAFPYHYIWTSLLPYWWMESDETLFLFVQTPDGWFMPLLPLGPGPLDRAVGEAFALMQRWNGPSPVSRIENAIGSCVPVLQGAGMRCRRRDGDYLYKAEALAALSGDDYKSQRGLCNRTERDQGIRIESYGQRHLAGCLALYERWSAQKETEHLDSMGMLLLQDARTAHECVLAQCERIGLSGTVVIVQGRIVAYTFGYWLTPQTWCVLLEVADRSMKGLAQWLFRETCRTALNRGAVYINAMDDAGLPGLRRAKSAYRPTAVLENWMVVG